MPADRWQQHNIIFVDRESARRTIAERLGPALIAAEADGQLTGWWFMNKQPWPLRYLADKPSPAIESLLSDLIGDSVIRETLASSSGPGRTSTLERA